LRGSARMVIIGSPLVRESARSERDGESCRGDEAAAAGPDNGPCIMGLVNSASVRLPMAKTVKFVFVRL
jgi:hypothetical protein